MSFTSISNAFFNEAVEDFNAAKVLFSCIKKGVASEDNYKDRFPRGSSLFMLLQMSIEKLAKAAYCKQRGDKRFPPQEHDLYLLMAIANRNPNLKQFFERNDITYTFIMKELNPLQPSNAKTNAPNLEYPWITNRNTIKYPAKDLNLIHRYLLNPDNRNLEIIMRTFEDFIDAFNRIMR